MLLKSSGLFIFFLVFMSSFSNQILYSESGSINDKLYPLWKYAAAGKLAARPAVSSDGVYLYSEDRNIHSLTTEGKLKWKFRIEGRPADSLSIGVDGTVYVCSMAGNLYAINPEGRLLWMHDLGGSPAGEPAVSVDGTVYLAFESGVLAAVSHTGFIRWKIDTGIPTDAPPLIDAGEAIYTFGSDGSLSCRTPWGGLLWEKSAAGEAYYGTASAVSNHILYTASADRLKAFKSDGSCLWSTETPAAASAIIIIPDAVFCLFENGLSAFYDFDGGLLKQSEEPGLSSYPAAGTSGIYILRGSRLVIMDFNGKLLSDRKPEGLTLMQPVLGENLLVCGTREWVACAFDAESSLNAGWTQKGGGASHDGASGEKKWHFNEAACSFNMDYLYLRNYLQSGDKKDKLDALAEIKERIAADGVDRGEYYLLHLVHQTLTGAMQNRIYPEVRAEAANILGAYGNFESVELLVSALEEEEYSHVSASIIRALGNLGTDYKGLASKAVYNKIVRENSAMYDRLVLAAVEASERILLYNGISSTGYAHRVLLEIMRGPYSSAMRRKAVEVLRSIQ